MSDVRPDSPRDALIAVSVTPQTRGLGFGVHRAMDNAGAQFQREGITLCYHNHAHEFQRYDGQYILDILLGAANASNLAAELDTYWVKYGGADPVATVGRWIDRQPASLLVLATHPPQTDQGATLGPITAGIVRASPHPVFIHHQRV